MVTKAVKHFLAVHDYIRFKLSHENVALHIEDHVKYLDLVNRLQRLEVNSRYKLTIQLLDSKSNLTLTDKLLF